MVIAAAGEPCRELADALPQDRWLPESFPAARLVCPGVVAVTGPSYETNPDAAEILGAFLEEHPALGVPTTPWPLLVLVDDAEFMAESFANFLWVTFTRSNPSHDVHGVGATIANKHWGCRGSLVIDARRKPHHAPPLVEPADVARAADALAARGRPLHGHF